MEQRTMELHFDFKANTETSITDFWKVVILIFITTFAEKVINSKKPFHGDYL